MRYFIIFIFISTICRSQQEFRIFSLFNNVYDSTKTFNMIIIDYSNGEVARFNNMKHQIRLVLKIGVIYEVRMKSSSEYMMSKVFIYVNEGYKQILLVPMNLLSRSKYSLVERCEGTIFYSSDEQEWKIYDSSVDEFIDPE